MKKTGFLAILLILVTCLLCGCFSGIMFVPDTDSIGQPKQFEKDGLEITLTDKFKEEQSQQGFDAYYVTSFCGVVVLKEEFTLEEDLADRPIEEYIKNVIANNGHTDIAPQNKDGLWYYERTSDSSYAQSYCYKGTDAFFIVQFICAPSDEQALKDTFYLWAQSVQVK